MSNYTEKLAQLTDHFGYIDEMAMLEYAAIDSVVPGICLNDGCDYSTDVDPNQERGWCETCETNTVMSCLILADII